MFDYFALFLRKSLLLLSISCLPFSAFPQVNVPVEQLIFEIVPLEEVENEPAPDYGPISSLPAFNSRNRISIAASYASPEDTSLVDRIYEIEEYLASAEEFESEEGPFSNQLKENVISLGELYQDQGDHQRAVEYLQRSLNIVRVNYGLNSLDQTPILESLAESYIALERPKRADETMQLILEVNTENYGSDNLELIPALEQFGDWNAEAFLDRSNIFTNVFRDDAQRFLRDPLNYIRPMEDFRNTPLFNLYQASNTYLRAISVILNQKNYTHPRLLELERKLIKTYFLRTHRENIVYEPDFYLTRRKSKTGSRLNTSSIELLESEDYDRGQESLERSIAYLASDPNADYNSLVSAMLEGADWNMLYSRKVKGLRGYEDIYEYIQANPEMEQAVSEQIYPIAPVALPIFMPAPNSREKMGVPADEEIPYLGHVDVSLRIDKYGKARRVRVLDRAGHVTRSMEIRLLKYFNELQFRPRFVDGEVNAEELRLRYLVGY